MVNGVVADAVCAAPPTAMQPRSTGGSPIHRQRRALVCPSGRDCPVKCTAARVAVTVLPPPDQETPDPTPLCVGLADSGTDGPWLAIVRGGRPDCRGFSNGLDGVHRTYEC